MADPISGTNTEKIDQLAFQVGELRRSVGELRTSVRIVGWALGTSLPLLASLQAFLVAQSFQQTATQARSDDRFRYMDDRLSVLKDIDRELRDQRDRLGRVEARLLGPQERRAVHEGPTPPPPLSPTPHPGP